MTNEAHGNDPDLGPARIDGSSLCGANTSQQDDSQQAATVKKRILFVDDQQQVLDGLRRMLRPMRDQWDMYFANGGQQALRQLAQVPCDVLVTDMRMPRMGGEDLLRIVQSQYPTMARIVLSGHADKDDIIKNVGPVHQFLSKPCDADTLKATLARTCELGDLIGSGDVKEMIAEMESLPSLPSLYQELLSQLETSEISVEQIGKTVSRDMGMSAKMLQLVNSAFFGVRRRVTEPADAVSLLGLDTVKALVVSIHVFSQFSADQAKSFSLDKLLEHGTTVSTFAKKVALAEHAQDDVMDHVFMAGILHDVGKLVCAARRPEKYAEALTLVREKKITFIEAEQQVYGATHAEVGAYLLGLWGFASPIVEAVAFHHCPGRSHVEGFSTLTAVHVANALANHCQDGRIDLVDKAVDLDYLGRLDLVPRLVAWIDACGVRA